MTRPSLPFIALALALGAPQPSLAWNDKGHMLVATIAQTQLSPAARKQLAALLKVGTDERTSTFATAACWADDNKSDTDRAWHYVDFYFRADGKPAKNKPDEQNILWAIDRNRSLLGDKKAPTTGRALALRYLLHFVGDVHQPLHNVARETDRYPDGDRGGNSFAIAPISGWGSRPVSNLHALWDFGAGGFLPARRPLSASDFAAVRDQANRIMREFPRSKMVELKHGQNARLWAAESESIAKGFVYSLPEGGAPPSAYLDRAARISRRRVALAGYRLAELLNQALK